MHAPQLKQCVRHINNMTNCSVLTHIWDYGWLAGDEVEVSAGISDQDVLEHYIADPVFITSFLSSGKDEIGIHGLFVADRIEAADYPRSEEAMLEEYLKQLLCSSEWDNPASEEQFANVLRELQRPFAEGMHCFLLRFDERTANLHHDWGFVFTVFREFLFLGQCSGLIKGYVIGYD